MKKVALAICSFSMIIMIVTACAVTETKPFETLSTEDIVPVPPPNVTVDLSLDEQKMNGEENPMESTTEVLMLKGLSFDYSSPMTWWENYYYLLETKGDKVYFSSSSAKKNKEKSWSVSDVEVPNSVLEDLSEIARSGGAVGSPKWLNPSKGVMDAPTYHYDLYWMDGTQTGPGTATEQIMIYLTALAMQCADEQEKVEA